MNATIHERSPIQRELEIRVEEAELQAAFDDAYKTMRPRLSLPGFRPGKAPLAVVKRLHGDAIEGDTLEKLAQEKYQRLLADLLDDLRKRVTVRVLDPLDAEPGVAALKGG